MENTQSPTVSGGDSPHLAADLAGVADAVPYLRASTDPTDGDWFGCARLCAEPEALAAVIRSTGEGRGTSDEQVMASLFVQGYAFRIAGVSVASWALHDRVIDPAAAATAITIGRARPNGVAFIRPLVAGIAADGRDSDAARRLDVIVADDEALLVWFFERLIDQHLRPFFASIRATFAIGERLLWGNAAASIATAFRALDGALPDDRRAVVQQRAEAFFAAAPAELQGVGQFLTIEAHDRKGWFWERTNCCLWYQTDSAWYCDDCSVRPQDERRAAFTASLAPADAEASS